MLIQSCFDFDRRGRGVAPSLEGNTPFNILCLIYSLYIVGYLVSIVLGEVVVVDGVIYEMD
jgi:hypothetical protein